MTNDQTEMRQEGERESMPEGEHVTRWPTLAVMGIAFLAIMGPLAFVMLRFGEAEDRLESQSKSICELAISNGHLAQSLDQGLALILADDDAEAAARAALLKTVTEGQAVVEEAMKECS